MGYSIWMLKKILKDKITLIIIFVCVVFIILICLLNANSKKYNDFVAVLTMDINSIKEINNQNNHFFKNEEEKNDLSKDDLEQLKKQKNSDDLFIDEYLHDHEQARNFYLNNQWSEALKIKLKYIDKDVSDLNNKNIQEQDLNITQAIVKTKTLYESLIKQNIQPDVIGGETQGFNFVKVIMENFFMLFFVFCMIILLSFIFTEQFSNNVNKEQLLPEKLINLQLKKVLVSSIILSLTYMCLLIFSFIISSILDQPGKIDYPTLVYISSTSYQTIAVGSVLSNTLLLQILAIIFIVSFVEFVGMIVRDKLATVFVSFISLIGVNLLIGKVSLIDSIAVILPNTYLSSVQIVNGQMANICKNNSISTITGAVTLVIYTVIFFTLSLLYKKIIGQDRSVKL